MKTIVVGGGFGEKKVSGIVSKLAQELCADEVVNGGSIKDLPVSLDGELIVWMPDIQNEEPKHYPLKSKGSVLVCSKVMREGYSKIDAVSRIFSMHGNAVIAIYKGDVCRFELIDALGNTWYQGNDIKSLSGSILDLYGFTRQAVRLPSVWRPLDVIDDRLPDEDRLQLSSLIIANAFLKDKIMTQCGNRFFGNLSTRCQSLFPSLKSNDKIYVSPRDSDKNMISAEDMILCRLDGNKVFYYGETDKKPSVDTPVQLELYNKKSWNFMIHGHAFLVKGDYSFFTAETKEYRLCGDFREVEEILSVTTSNPEYGIINLKNHGFLAFSNTLENLTTMLSQTEWEMRG